MEIMETRKGGEMLESWLSLGDLEKMQSLFSAGDSAEALTLRRADFVEQASSAIGHGSPEEFGRMFDGADVSRQGRMGWPQMASFLLLTLSEKDEHSRAAVAPCWRPLRALQLVHRGPVQQVAHLATSNRYLSVSQEGTLAIWGDELTPLKTHHVSTDSVKRGDLWVSGMAVLQNVQKVAVSFTSKEIGIFDLLSKQEFSCQYKLQGLRHPPICLDYWSNPHNPDQAVLSFGDMGGQVNAICFTAAHISLFERPSTGVGHNSDVIKWAELVEGHHRCCYTLQHHAHGNDWVRRVKFLGSLEAFVSCSIGRESSVVVAWREKEATPLRVTSGHVGGGVNDLDFHAGLSLLATAGVDGKVCLWNPHMMSKPVGVLQGHTTSVMTVSFLPDRKLLLSFSKDKVLRIWDVHHQLCVQRLTGIFPKTQEFRTLLVYHEERGRLFLTFNNLLTLLEAKKDESRVWTSHEHEVTCVLYNSYLKQVISSDAGSTVIFWLVDTGHKVKKFTQCHGKAEISTMALDGTQTRLFTGGKDGMVKVWDLNGHCHHKLEVTRGQAVGISRILVLKRSVLVLGWDRMFAVFRQSMFSKFHVQPSEWKGGVQHQDDVISAAFSPPQTLVTGSCDGAIVVWNSSTEYALRKLGPDILSEPQSRSDEELLKQHMASVPTCDTSMVCEVPLLSAAPGGWEDLEGSHAVTRLCFLEGRRSAATAGGADLVSCGGAALVRFWNATRGQLVARFLAHASSSSIIMTVDGSGGQLITGDMDGEVKVWDIQDYGLLPARGEVTHPPKLRSCFRPHTGCVTQLETCCCDGRVLLLSASADRRLVLSQLAGTIIGTFGQEEHWNILEIPDKLPGRWNEALSGGEKLQSTPLDPEDPLRGSPQNLEMDNEIRESENHMTEMDPRQLTTGTSSILGSSYKERRRPIENASRNYEETPKCGGTFSSLHLYKLAPVEAFLKPDFVTNPQLSFGTKWEHSFQSPGPPPSSVDIAKARSDDNEILELDAGMGSSPRTRRNGLDK
ncbi:WD repeat-containing protein 49-like isoform X1 [Brienomyrus brachyistius]|uniref:WD repeat-containing protein 49-like isoform X1 n=1 Tax=Brienomyrus brachyistius TaxID=42636 RepID=UPI0020B32316|nr:WD repeat-containing protein 49-like isoform X1 [Brienomyrus brachyistius]XP_048836776.1 WD repeat-containing protein 49-like isoform X1 [Brienomyrus brachyistius]XP_048836777.1 WD repeat-containing protein 49-like isoform X1 [Brienomyrus brachyistius]